MCCSSFYPWRERGAKDIKLPTAAAYNSPVHSTNAIRSFAFNYIEGRKGLDNLNILFRLF